MKDFTKYESWKGSHSSEMADLDFAKPNDIFIYTRFTIKSNVKMESRRVVFAEDESEALGYFRHIFLYDILNDTIDDLQNDYMFCFKEKQGDIVRIMNYWFKLGKLAKVENCIECVLKICKDFNNEFGSRDDVEYEIHICKTADRLRKFLNNEYKDDINFDKKRLNNICSNDFFVGRKLKEFLDNLFRS